MKTADIMTREVIAVERSKPITEIAQLLVANKIHGVPVIDEDMKIVGIITETDFFSKDASSIYLPSFIDMIRSEDAENIAEKNPDVNYVLGATAKDIMSPECFYVNPQMRLEDLIKIFRETGYKTIPVANEKDVLVGIVTVSDIIRMI